MDKNEKKKGIREIELNDLEKVTGGSLADTSKKNPDPVSPDTQKNV